MNDRSNSTWSAWLDYLLWAISYCNVGAALGSAWEPRRYFAAASAPPFPLARRWGGPWGDTPPPNRPIVLSGAF